MCDMSSFQYCNELSMTIELDSTLAQAEVLFLSYSQLIADIDRREAEVPSARSRTTIRQRRAGSVSGAAGEGQQQAKRLVVSKELRELLNAGQ